MQLSTLPVMGVVALLVDGAAPTQIAAALDISTSAVRELASSAVAELLLRTNDIRVVAGDEMSRASLWKLAQNMNKVVNGDKKTISWLDVLTDVEFVEVTETRAYFRAFRNSKLNQGVTNG